MMTWKSLGFASLVSSSFLLGPSIGENSLDNPKIEDSRELFNRITTCYTPKGCVFRTIYGEESSEDYAVYNTPKNVVKSIDRGLEWVIKAQHADGGWGAGGNAFQHVRDPHAVKADPATTAMVAMALLRTGSLPDKGPYANQLNRATTFLLNEVENTPVNRIKITAENNTQIQSKLGDHIDAVLTLQYFSNLMEYLENSPALKKRVTNAMNICAEKIQSTQNLDGSFSGAGWAGVLQSAFANNALESAKFSGVNIDDDVLEKSREYQKGNFDAESGEVNTARGAGITLYSVSGSVRASAKEARKVKEEVRRARESGIIPEDAEINPSLLEEIGFENEEALKYSTSFQVYENSKDVAQRQDVMEGFGNNGGEEFLSYLQTGESLIINQDEEWQKWYTNMSGRLIAIQNSDGSWNGHHCITSPVFCTATTLLTLSINNDAEKLLAQGAQK